MPSLTPAKRFSAGWTDLLDPGCGYEASTQVIRTATTADTYYDYTLYLTPTVYTVAEGHNLKLLIFAQDPFRSRLDDTVDDTPVFFYLPGRPIGYGERLLKMEPIWSRSFFRPRRFAIPPKKLDRFVPGSFL